MRPARRANSSTVLVVPIVKVRMEAGHSICTAVYSLIVRMRSNRPEVSICKASALPLLRCWTRVCWMGTGVCVCQSASEFVCTWI